MSPTLSIANNTRELIVQLSRGNDLPARSLAGSVQAELNLILSTDSEAAGNLRAQAQQTLYAIEEVLALIDQKDLRAAWKAARDAAQEWRAISQSQD